jgi:hypothetical protein
MRLHTSAAAEAGAFRLRALVLCLASPSFLVAVAATSHDAFAFELRSIRDHVAVDLASKFAGSVTTADERIVFPPRSAASVGVFDPENDAFSTMAGDSTTSNQHCGGALAHDGRVVFAPFKRNAVGTFEPAFDYFKNNVDASMDSTTLKFAGACAVPDGRVVFVPNAAANVRTFDPETHAHETHALPAALTAAAAADLYFFFGGGAFSESTQKVVFSPRDADVVGLFDPVSNATTTLALPDRFADVTQKFMGAIRVVSGGKEYVVFPPDTLDEVGVYAGETGEFSTSPLDNATTHASSVIGVAKKFDGGAALSDGRVVFAPRNVPFVGVFDPETLETSFISTPAQPGGPANGWYSGASATRDGRVVFTPRNSNDILLMRLYCVVEAPANGNVGDCPSVLNVGETCTPSCEKGFVLRGQTRCETAAPVSAQTARCVKFPEQFCFEQSSAMGFVTKDVDLKGSQSPFTTRGLRAWFANRDLVAGDIKSARWKSREGDFVGRFGADTATGKCAGTCGVFSQPGHGAGGDVVAIHGSSTSNYLFGVDTNLVPSGEWSMCAVTRYDGAVRQRVLKGSVNFIWGHFNNFVGIAFEPGNRFFTSPDDTPGQVEGVVGDRDDWVVTCGTYAAQRRSFFANSVNVASRVTSTSGYADAFRVGINYFDGGPDQFSGGGENGENSDFAVAELIVWSRALADDELRAASDYLRRDVLKLSRKNFDANRAHTRFANPRGVPPFAKALRAWFASADLETTGDASTLDQQPETLRWRSRVGDFSAQVTGGAFAVRSVAGHGASKRVKAVHGAPSTGFIYGVGANVVPAGAWSMCSVSRYDGAARSRVLQGSKNIIWGQYNGWIGAAHMCNTWKTSYNSQPSGVVELMDDWLVFCGTNALGRRAFFANDVNTGTSAGAGDCDDFALGAGPFSGVFANTATDASDFALADLLVWNVSLSEIQLAEMSRYLRATVLGVSAKKAPFEDSMHAWFASADLRSGGTAWTSRVGNHVADVAAGIASVAATDGHGARKKVLAMHGTYQTQYNFGGTISGEKVIPNSEWSMCSVARYDGVYRNRLLQASASVVWGHYGGGQGGTAKLGRLSSGYLCGTWVTRDSATRAGVADDWDDWVVFCGSNGGGRASYYANGVQVGVSSLGLGNGCKDLSVALNTYQPNEVTDFAIAELMTWNRALTDVEMMQVTHYLRAEVLGRDDASAGAPEMYFP